MSDYRIALTAVGFVLVTFIGTGAIIWKTKDINDVEIVKLRFAQVMFVGIITTFIFTAMLYMFSSSDRGKDIFDKALNAMTPLAGVIIGYLFSSRADTGKHVPTEHSNHGGPSGDNKGANTPVKNP
jgi:hypothetical protein